MVTTSPLDLSKPHSVTVTFISSPLSSLLQGNFVGMARRYFKMKQLLDEQVRIVVAILISYYLFELAIHDYILFIQYVENIHIVGYT